MALLQNLTEAARLAINRMPVFSEKEKRLMHVALDAQGAGGGGGEVVADTSPTLGGNLETNDFWIQNTAPAGEVTIYAPNGWTNISTLGAQIGYSDGLGALVFDNSPKEATLFAPKVILSSTSGGDIVLNAAGKVVIDGLNWPTADGAANTLLKTNGTGQLSFAPLDIVNDTSPQLGGNLDLLGNSILDTAGTITIGTANYIYATANLQAGLHTGSSGILVNPTTVAISSTTGDITLLPTTGKVVIDGMNWPTADSTSDFVLTTNGAGQLSWSAKTPAGGGITAVVQDTAPQLGGNLDVNGKTITSVTNGNIPITPNGTGKIILDGLSWPIADGTANYVLKTDGAGNLSWTAQTGGAGTFLALSDTPGSYATFASDWVRVNAGATALEFVDPPVQSVAVSSPLVKTGTTAVSLSIPAAAGPSTNGYMSGADKGKLDLVEAQADVTDAANVGTAFGAMTEFTGVLLSTDELMIRDGTVASKCDISYLQAYMQANLSLGGYTHPNHTGQVTSIGDGAQVLTASAITAQTDLPSGLVGTDELLVSDDGVLKRMDVSVLQAFMDAANTKIDGQRVWIQNTAPTTTNVDDIWIDTA